MADEQQLAILLQGRDVWNAWREQNRKAKVDLSRANLTVWNLSWADLSWADLSWRTCRRRGSPNLREATLYGARLYGAQLIRANLNRANLTEASLFVADLFEADLSGRTSPGPPCRHELHGHHPHGMPRLRRLGVEPEAGGGDAKELIITPSYDPKVTVDNLEVARFIYLLLNNERVRHNTITSKVVLILGQFTLERKVVLDALREELRQRDYTPVLFDFEKPTSKDLTGTVQTLANMARFIIADVTDPSRVPHELAMVIPNTPVAVQPVLLKENGEYAMFVDLRTHYAWVLKPYRYASAEGLIADLGQRVMAPAEAKARKLQAMSSPTGARRPKNGR